MIGDVCFLLLLLVERNISILKTNKSDINELATMNGYSLAMLGMSLSEELIVTLKETGKNVVGRECLI
jgi:hypothetical protein